MRFLQKTLFRAVFLYAITSLPASAQWREGWHKDKPINAPVGRLSKDSIRKYWIEMFNNKHIVWTGLGVGFFTGKYRRWADEATFMPKHRNDLYGLRLRLSFSREDAGLPTAYTREVSALYGKVRKGYKFMATASAGLSVLWGQKWIDRVGAVTTPPARGLRTTSSTSPLYTTEKFWTIGVPIRAQAFYIAGKEVALGITLGTTLNIKQLWGDAMFTMLLGFN